MKISCKFLGYFLIRKASGHVQLSGTERSAGHLSHFHEHSLKNASCLDATKSTVRLASATTIPAVRPAYLPTPIQVDSLFNFPQSERQNE